MDIDGTPAPTTVFEEDGFLYTVTDGLAAIIRFPEGFLDLSAVPLSLGRYPSSPRSGRVAERIACEFCMPILSFTAI